MLRAPLAKIIPFSSVDGPGNRIAIFFQGCNFNCKFCHNPETITFCVSCGACVNVCPTNALRIEDEKVLWDESSCCGCEECIKVCENNSSPRIEYVTSDELYKKIQKYLPFVSGITVSGGECTLHHEFIAEFFALIKKTGKTVFVDSNGLLDFKTMPNLLEVMDKAMIDVKSTLEDEHKDLVGKSCRQVLENVSYLASIGKLFEIRTVIIPNYLNNSENVKVASLLIKDYPEVRYKLIKYRQFGVRDSMMQSESPSDEYMETLKDLAIKLGVSDVVII